MLAAGSQANRLARAVADFAVATQRKAHTKKQTGGGTIKKMNPRLLAPEYSQRGSEHGETSSSTT